MIVDKKPKHSSVTVMCVLAYLDRYVYPVLILLAGLLAELFRDRNTMLCVLALGILLDGIYNLVGYLCRWKHIYLCYQSMSHTKMTPTRIEWERLAKKDAYGVPAALIIGDKTDVRRSRVREKPKASFDIHDRVNYAVTDQTLKINTDKKVISLNLQIDTDICSMYEYFEIFLQRMLMCRGAADMLGATFKLTANGAKVL